MRTTHINRHFCKCASVSHVQTFFTFDHVPPISPPLPSLHVIMVLSPSVCLFISPRYVNCAVLLCLWGLLYFQYFLVERIWCSSDPSGLHLKLLIIDHPLHFYILSSSSSVYVVIFVVNLFCTHDMMSCHGRHETSLRLIVICYVGHCN